MTAWGSIGWKGGAVGVGGGGGLGGFPGGERAKTPRLFGRLAGVDRRDAPRTDLRLKRVEVRRVVDGPLERVRRRAAHLQGAVEAVERFADGARRDAHRCPSVRFERTRTIVLRASATLNALPGSGCAPSSPAPAAARKLASGDRGP